MIEKKKYEAPQMEVEKVDAVGIICTSPTFTSDPNEEYDDVETTDWWN